MEYYIDDGVIYPVAPDRLEEFLRDHPNAQPYDKEQDDQQVETSIAEPVIEEQPDPFIGPMAEEDPVLDAPISTAISPRQQEIKDIEKIQEFSNKVDSSPVVEKSSLPIRSAARDQDIKNIGKSIDKIIGDYEEKYKDTIFEFEKVGFGFDPTSPTTWFDEGGIRLKGENGVEEIIPLKDINLDGNFHKKINDFIAKNANEEVRNKTKPIENNIKSFLNNQLNVDEEGWRWYGQAAGDDIRKKGVQSLEHYIETFGQEGLRKELRKNWNKNNIQPGTRDFFSLEDTMEIAGVSDYRYDQIFDEAINNQISKEKRNEFESKRNELKKEITQRYGDDFLLKIDDDDVDYRDLPEYEQISNLYFKQAIDELDDEQIAIANKNADSLKKSYELARLIEAGGDANEIADLKSEIETLQSDAKDLLQEYNGKNTILFFDYSEGASRIAPPKKEEGKGIPLRSGTRTNKDGTESTHLMAAETFDGKNWYAFPTLFQDEDGKWVDMSDEPREKAYEEALNRDEVINFGENKEKALAFGEGSWKEKSKGESVQKEYDDFISELSILKSEDFQGLQERFNINSLTKDELDERLNKTYNLAVGDYNPETPNKDSKSQFITKLINLGYEYDKEKESFTDVKMSDLVSLSEHSSVIKQYIDPEAKPTISMDLGASAINLREQVKINSVERKALTDMYLLNIDPADMRRIGEGKGERDTFWNDVSRFSHAFAEGAIETLTEDQYTIFSKSDKIAQAEKIGNELGIPWNEEQQENFKETYAEFTGKTLGALPQIATEFAILNAVTSGIATATGLSESLMAMRIGRLYKNGKQVSHAAVNAKALKKGYSLNPRGLKKFYKRFGYTLKGATLPEKANALVITSLLEEGKMQLMGLPTGSGFAFGMAGQTFASVTNRLGLYFTEKSGLQALNGALKLGRGGISFSIAAPTASNLEAAIEDIIGGKDFQTFIDEHYRELSGEEIFRRSLGEFLTGFGFAIGHLKKADFAVTMNQQKALLARARRLVKEEEAKPEKERDYSKIEKYNNLASAVGRKLDVAAGYYRYFTPEILVKRAEKDLKKNKDRAVEEYGEFWETKVQIGNKGLGDSSATIKNINGKKTLVVNALSWRNKGLIPHEMAHFYSEKAGFTEEEFEKLYDIVELHADAALKERYTEKGYKSFKDFIETEYKKVGEKGALGSEKIANLIEFLSSDKSIMKNIIENNAFYGFEQGIKSFYERRLQDKGFFKGKEIGFQDAQDVMNALFRIANSTGKRGVSRQWEQLRNLVQFNNEIVDVKKNKIVGKSNVKTSALDLAIEKQEKLQKEALKTKKELADNKELYQSTDRIWNEYYQAGEWGKDKKNVAEDIALDRKWVGHIFNRLTLPKYVHQLKGFEKTEIESLAWEFISAEKRGLIDLISKFEPGRMIDPVTKKPSLSIYLNSLTKQGVPAIDLRLMEFYRDKPEYGLKNVSLNQEGVLKNVEKQLTTEQVDFDAAVKEFKTEVRINPLTWKGAGFKPQKDFNKEYIQTIENRYNSLPKVFETRTGVKINKADLMFSNMPEFLSPRHAAEFWGVSEKKLQEFANGKKKQISDFTPPPAKGKRKVKTEILKDPETGEVLDKLTVGKFSEIENIQRVADINAEGMVGLLHKQSTIPLEMPITRKDVRRDLQGISLNIYDAFLNKLFNKTGKRSNGINSQVEIWELKSEYKGAESAKNLRNIVNDYNGSGKQFYKGLVMYFDRIMNTKILKDFKGKELVRKGSLDPKLQRVVDNLHTGLPAKISTLNLSQRGIEKLTKEDIRRGYTIADLADAETHVLDLLARNPKALENIWSEMLASRPKAEIEGLQYIEDVASKGLKIDYKKNVITWTSKTKWTPKELKKSKEDYFKNYLSEFITDRFIPGELFNGLHSFPRVFLKDYFKFGSKNRGVDDTNGPMGKRMDKVISNLRLLENSKLAKIAKKVPFSKQSLEGLSVFDKMLKREFDKSPHTRHFTLGRIQTWDWYWDADVKSVHTYLDRFVGDFDLSNIKGEFELLHERRNKIKELELTHGAKELQAKWKKAKGENKENIEIALQEKFKVLPETVQDSGIDIYTGKERTKEHDIKKKIDFLLDKIEKDGKLTKSEKEFLHANELYNAWKDFVKVREFFEPANSQKLGKFNIKKIVEIIEADMTRTAKIQAISKIIDPKVAKALVLFDYAMTLAKQNYAMSQGEIGTPKGNKAMEYLYRDYQMTTNNVISDRATAPFVAGYIKSGPQKWDAKGEHAKMAAANTAEKLASIENRNWQKDFAKVQSGYHQWYGPKGEEGSKKGVTPVYEGTYFNKLDWVLGKNSPKGESRLLYDIDLLVNMVEFSTGKSYFEKAISEFARQKRAVLEGRSLRSFAMDFIIDPSPSNKITLKNVLKNKTNYDNIHKHNGKLLDVSIGKKTSSLDLSRNEILHKLKNIDKAIELARDKNKKRKGISVLDFDDTVAKTKSKVIVYAPAFKPGTSQEVSMKLTPAEFAKRHADLERMGASFDFSEFTKVVKGKKGPLFDKLQKAVNKFGNENVFILTARPKESAAAIQTFLKGLGAELKIENITGLEDGRPSAKTQWVVDRAAEGYNDFYFADDAIANVKAVKKVLDIIDVKSKVQQAKSSLNLSDNFNKIIEYSTGIGADKTFSAAKARLMGKGKRKWNIYIPSRAEDFHMLTMPLFGKGAKGMANEKWFEENLYKPFSRGDLSHNTEIRVRMNDYFALRNQLKDTGSKFKDLFTKHPLNKPIEKGKVWTNQHAIRIYNWAKQGTLPGDVSKADVKKLVKHVNNNPKLKAFADQMIEIHKGDGYPKPSNVWLSETVTQDVLFNGKETSRSKHLKEFIENADIIFSEKNLNKLESAFGKPWRIAMEASLHRMKTGQNRNSWGTKNKWESDALDWMHGSIGSTMFLNTRSAFLQQVSLVNYINYADNNPFQASKAFANQKQFWADYSRLMNSDWALNRRDGLRFSIAESEILDLSRGAKNPAAVAINWALSKGFIMTKYMDSHATAFGGASFYRNRINTYKKQKLGNKEAERKAYEEWVELSDKTQQTARYDMVSMEQASVSGKLILNYNNVSLNYAKFGTKKQVSDLINGRYDHLYKGNNSVAAKLGRIAWYQAIQGGVFYGLQMAMFKYLFDDAYVMDGEEKEMANAILDQALIGGGGIAGKSIATLKNWILKLIKEGKKKRPDYADTLPELLKISPPLDKKARQMSQALNIFTYDMSEIKKKGFSLDNPALKSAAKVIEAATNAPVDRLMKKEVNISTAVEKDRAHWQRPFLMLGWEGWQFEKDKNKKKTKKRKKGFNLDFDFNTDFDLDFDVDF